MNMKKILQAMDGVASKPVVGADSMAKFLRVVSEAEINQSAPVTPTAPAAPTQPQVDPAHYKVPSVEFLKKNYQHPSQIISGAQPSESDPTRIGAWAVGSDFDDLMMALSGSYYQARKADPNFKQPAFVKDDWELVQRLLGTPEGKEYAIANWIGLSDINDKSPEAEFNRAQHKEFEKQSTAKLMQQPNGVIAPGWKYDQKLGMTPAQAELQKQQQPVPVQENSLNKFLSIIDKHNVSILNEGSNPHKVALPVQMAMQHYQQPETTQIEKKKYVKDGIRKFFREVETQTAEQIAAEQSQKRQLINQYAQAIAERVLMKEDKATARDKWNKTSDERDKKHTAHEKEIAKLPVEKRSGAAIDALEKHLKDVKENEIPDHSMGFTGGVGPGMQSNEPTESHEQAPHHSPEDLGGADAYYGRPADHRKHDLTDHEHIRAYYHGYRAGEDMHDKSNYDESVTKSLRKNNPCWKNYKPIGTKKKGGKTVPNCVPKK